MRTHVLAVRLDSAGDVLVTGPAVRALAARAGRVTFLAGPSGREAAELLPGVDEILELAAPWIEAKPPPVRRAAIDRVVAEVRARDVEEAVIFTSFHQSALPTALLLRLADVSRIAAISDDYPGSLLDIRHRVPDDVHEVERALSLAAAAGYELPPGYEPCLQVKATPARRLVGRRYVVVHPGASVPARAWSPTRCRELVGLLGVEGRRVLVTGAPSERALTAYVAGGSPHAHDLGGRTTLATLAGVLASAEAVVCGNTGPAHLAAAVGTPIVSVYAPTVPAVRWRPWRVPHVLLGDQEIACAGCRARACPVPGHPCVDTLRPADVAASVAELIGPAADVWRPREAGVKDPMLATEAAR